MLYELAKLPGFIALVLGVFLSHNAVDASRPYGFDILLISPGRSWSGCH
jgi:hypothetical protein